VTDLLHHHAKYGGDPESRAGCKPWFHVQFLHTIILDRRALKIISCNNFSTSFHVQLSHAIILESRRG